MANVLAAILLVAVVKADSYNGYGWNRDGGGRGWRYGDDNDDDDDGDGNSIYGDEANGFGLGSAASFDRANNVLIAHAIVASAVWVLFVPWAALILRINLKSPIVLKLHAGLQIFSYLVYIAGAGMGIWLAQQMAPYGVWNDVHPRLGLAILAIAFFQPIFGFVHHRIFKKRGRVHLWVGRSLIVLGIINGGLGIRLTSFSPFRTDAQTRTSAIVYGVIAGVMFALYALLVAMFETRRKRAQGKAPPYNIAQQKGLPSYEESQSSASSLASRQNTGGYNGTGPAPTAAPIPGGNAPRYS
ncbi:uncharacterized protein HMPREF1541_10811 [Cyphellophora europaea CBS 101466]|uniref:Cytochrome b561 domain-containing protein n=1 Tax=Cyphellophora europaea (strain CBS 101466) TaxID=1220924 RepID=W2S6K3_CYPE1|nr:uncharacterized protein HMPREF1541_10811 [Cyphellophora europaea CBS 101466]ETN44260.1 hypothetical protein HMPREF1541_10811 [Cyphellophora europaea CBS 101466]